MLVVLIFIILFLFLVNFIVSKKLFKDREKMSSFECGFDSILKNRLPFSLHFYLVSIIFLIFDIEIAVIMPFMVFSGFDFMLMVKLMIMILFILLMGLFMEWIEGALSWIK
uniref:NADH dehydrogenase subunit 3 n=1 Tax=Cheiloneurus chinensis TaxID=3082044 RepID=UPI002A82FB32|nr:NADH dehydrogenase subunit 3 [Cheiloneurus chinensis]WOE90950.1 NADH dehydrogenase subunit 3 [Cheiloneurus chinensis]